MASSRPSLIYVCTRARIRTVIMPYAIKGITEMQLMLRDRGFGDLVAVLRGKKVMIWTCNTCARLCDVGGSSNAQKLASALRAEGIEVTGVRSAKAACIQSAVEECKGPESDSCDVILALTCDVGSEVAAKVYGKQCVNPVVTIGTGYCSADGVPILRGCPERTLAFLSEEKRLPLGPF